MALHGMRLDKTNALNLMQDLIFVDHPHIDVLQLHHADTLRCSDRDILLVKLDGRDVDSLTDIYSDTVNISGKIDRYCTGFLANYGYYRRHAYLPSSSHREGTVTYGQAYNSAAKMARPSDSGYVACYTICRGYRNNPSTYMRNLSESTKQYLRDIISYTRYYVRDNHALRIEQVTTFDSRQCPVISAAVTQAKIFQETSLTTTTEQLLERKLIYRCSNWSRYVDDNVEDDLDFLSQLLNISNIAFENKTYIPTEYVSRAIKAEFRIMYFVHGRNTQYNYQVM